MEARLSVRQVKAARALLSWNQNQLAEACGVSAPTVKYLEQVGGILGGRPATAHAIRSALEEAGIIFLFEDGEGEGVRLKAGVYPNEITRRHRRRRVTDSEGAEIT